MSSRANSGASAVSTGFSPRNISACDLPTIWMLPIGNSKSSEPKVEVVEAERLLKDRRVLLLRERQHRPAGVEHVVAADLVGGVGESVGVLLAGRGEEQLGRVCRAARDDDDVRRVRLRFAAPLAPRPPVTVSARSVRVQLHGLGAGQQGDVGVLQSRAARRAPRRRTWRGRGRGSRRRWRSARMRCRACSSSFSITPQGAWNGMQALGRKVVGQLLDPGLVGDRRERVLGACRGLGRILAAGAVDLVELLGLGVVGLELLVGDRPGRGDAVVVSKLAEVLRAEAVERGPVELRRAADEVVHLRLERLPVRVVPGVLGDVAIVDEDRLGGPVLRLRG